MKANELVIGARYIYQMQDGKKVEVTHTRETTVTNAMYFTPEGGCIGSCLGRIR